MIGIGIIGFGTVGQGTYRILRDHGSLIRERTGLEVKVTKIAEIDPARRVGAKDVAFVNDAMELIDDRDVDIVVELMGGTDASFRYIQAALERKKWVVTANKALLAERGDELFAIAERHESEIAFEASVGGGIPVIRSIREGLVGNKIPYLMGILNGTSNYILTRMTDQAMSFQEALAEAQLLGFAERDSFLDTEGIDAAHKLCILIRLAFRYPLSMKEIGIVGISRIDPVDIAFAREFGYRIKLLGVAREEREAIEARVAPAMIPINHPMSNVLGVFNAVYVVGDMVGANLYYGKGAGSDPTGSAVVSDIVDVATRRLSGRPKMGLAMKKDGRRVKKSEESAAPFYMRFKAEDRPGVLSRISGILADYGISISTVVQKGRKEHDYVPIVMVTHEAQEGNLRRAAEEINRLSFVEGQSIHIRIETGEGVS